MEYILSIDQGTTSSKAFLMAMDGSMHKGVSYEVEQFFPNPGYVEQQPEQILSSVLMAISSTLELLGSEDKVISIAITNQRETTICFDKASGKAFCNAIVWQCRRTTPICEREEFRSRESLIQNKTGLKLDPYFSATKMKWMMEENPRCKEGVQEGRLLLSTVDAYLVFQFTQGRVFASDYSNCSRTMLFDINKLEYDDELLTLFDIPRQALPKPMPSCSDYGAFDMDEKELKSLGLTDDQTKVLATIKGVSISAVAGDQAAALFGQACIEKGQSKTTYGTGCFTLLNIGMKPQMSKNGLLTSATWSFDGKTYYALEGSLFQVGSVITWLQKEMHLISKPSDCDAICNSLKDNGGVYLVPAFTGLGAPYWQPNAKGSISGITQGTTSEHFVRAGVESIAYQVAKLLECMNSETQVKLSEMKVDGGICACEFLMQFQSDITHLEVIRAASDEMTAKGVGMLAMLTIGILTSIEETKYLYASSDTYSPKMKVVDANRLIDSYEKAVNMVVN